MKEVRAAFRFLLHPHRIQLLPSCWNPPLYKSLCVPYCWTILGFRILLQPFFLFYLLQIFAFWCELFFTFRKYIFTVIFRDLLLLTILLLCPFLWCLSSCGMSSSFPKNKRLCHFCCTLRRKGREKILPHTAMFMPRVLPLTALVTAFLSLLLGSQVKHWNPLVC